MSGVRPSRLLVAMLRRAVASRTENCWSPSRPAGTVGLPPPPVPPSVALGPPSDAAAATPALAPMNWRRLSLLLISGSPLLPPWGGFVGSQPARSHSRWTNAADRANLSRSFVDNQAKIERNVDRRPALGTGTPQGATWRAVRAHPAVREPVVSRRRPGDERRRSR